MSDAATRAYEAAERAKAPREPRQSREVTAALDAIEAWTASGAPATAKESTRQSLQTFTADPAEAVRRGYHVGNVRAAAIVDTSRHRADEAARDKREAMQRRHAANREATAAIVERARDVRKGIPLTMAQMASQISVNENRVRNFEALMLSPEQSQQMLHLYEGVVATRNASAPQAKKQAKA